MNRLANKVALVTGSAGGIGRGIAIRFAQEGAKVGVLDLSNAASQKVVDEIEAFGGQALALEADISQEHDVKKVTFVIGGCRSGKSHHALEMADGFPGDKRVFIATCIPRDDEMKTRVRIHVLLSIPWIWMRCPGN